MVLHAHTEEKETPQWTEKTKKTAVKSKRFIDKVMGLCAVGRPQGDFDGILGVYRCSEKKQAERNSGFHAAGDWYEVDCEVNGSRFVHMIQNHLIPDIQRKLLGFDCVYVQMDGAKAHVKAWDEIEKLAATRIQMHGQKTPIIRFVKQPANSPDTNVLDLCFFCSLGMSYRRTKGSSNKGISVRKPFGSTSCRLSATITTKRPWIGAGG
jgi:hypothetical protein